MVTDYTKLESLLKEKKLNSRQAAILAGVSQPILSNWKAGRREPSLGTLKKLADHFGVTVDYFLK